MNYRHIQHPFPPVFDAHSQILILGSLPSVKSRENEFYYGHPRNRFWPMLAGIFGCTVPRTVEEKKAMLLEHNIALWDVIASCDIIGSDDSSIKNAEPTNVPVLLKEAPIRRILINGKTAYRLYEKYLQDETGMEAVPLPSTSPANAAFSLERLMELWGKALHGESE